MADLETLQTTEDLTMADKGTFQTSKALGWHPVTLQTSKVRSKLDLEIFQLLFSSIVSSLIGH
jgi:hypothetical protein